MNEEELQAIREWCEKATPGPWMAVLDVVELNKLCVEIVQDRDECCGAIIGPSDVAVPAVFTYSIRISDAEFIAHARQDVPALLAEVARLRAENDRLQAENDKLQSKAHLRHVAKVRREWGL